jgi:hypothetical protein
MLACVAACGIRAPGRVDVETLVRTRGPVEARRDLQIEILAHPRDVGARLALAALDDKLGRPSEAIEQLETVSGLGGPLGPRWHEDDRARLGRLLAARGRLRLGRGAVSALEDLKRARGFGAPIEDAELTRARIAVATADLRHVDAGIRARGRGVLAELASSPLADTSWAGAKPHATAGDRGAFGTWLWAQGAKRAAWEELDAWHQAAADKQRFQPAYLRAFAWWSPIDAPPPPVSELVGPERCRFTAAPSCEPATLIASDGLDSDAIRALLAAPITPTANAADATAWAAITLAQALRGEGGWGAALAARVDLRKLDIKALPPYVRPIFARLVGRSEPGVDDPALVELRPYERLVVAAERVLDGAAVAQVRIALGEVAATDPGKAVLGIAEPHADVVPGEPLAAATSAHVVARGHVLPALAAILAAYRRDTSIADRLALDAVAESPDAASAHAALGALFQALADPARARAAWQAAVAASPEPAFTRGLAEAIARAGDPDAALIATTTAAAASGDPAVVWVAVARALEGVGSDVHALEAARIALDLAGPNAAADALDVAIAASRALGRTPQADALAARRARIAPPPSPEHGDDDPTDAPAALAAYTRYATGSTVARMWVASRWNPRDVPIRAALLSAVALDDPRRRVIIAELVALAGDRDPDLGRAAIKALR